jgi:signal transduction histidine kinase/CheY-like chemotaxis protein
MLPGAKMSRGCDPDGRIPDVLAPIRRKGWPMLQMLTWQALRDPQIAGDVEGLREDTRRSLLQLAAGGYVVWHTASIFLTEPTGWWRYWLLALLVGGGFALTHALERRGRPGASAVFLGSCVAGSLAATWLFQTPLATAFLPLAAVAAVVIVHPLAGLVVVGAASGLLGLLWWAGPLAFLGAERLVEVLVASSLTVVLAQALGRNTVVAVEWALHSYHREVASARLARSQRGRLARTLAQLDRAYEQLQHANAELVMAWKTAQAAERSKTEFVTNISHELRTPLNLIAGFSDMVLTSPESYGVPLPAPYRRDLNAIYQSTQHLLTLANDVIDLARVGMGRLALAREPIHLAQVIADACDIVREYVEAKGLTLRVEAPPDLPVVSIDRLRIRQVLLNLLTNAARFTDRGGITISAVEDGDRVIVRVVDTGRGVPPDDLARVFEEFHHDGGRSEPIPAGLGGIGLGLPISKRFVELHGGTIGVESAPGVGTTFWFSLPANAVDGAVHDPTWRPLQPYEAAGARERVLVLAGADARHGQVLQHYLRGYRVIAAHDPAAASAVAHQFHAVAVAADCQDARSDQLRVSVPLLRLPLPLGDRMASLLGVHACLVKPVGRVELRAVLAGLGRSIRSVLVVDDDPRFVHLMSRMLPTLFGPPGLSVETAHTGREALERMRVFRPDLLLIDLVMPEMGGAEVIAAMQATPELADVPVVVISAQDQIDQDLALQGPLSLTRPEGFRLEELLGLVEALLGALPPSRPSAPAAEAEARGARRQRKRLSAPTR